MNGKILRIFPASICIAMVAMPAPFLLCAQTSTPGISSATPGTAGATPRFKDFQSFQAWRQSIHKATVPGLDLSSHPTQQSFPASAQEAEEGEVKESLQSSLGVKRRNRKIKDASGVTGFAVDPTDGRNAVLLGTESVTPSFFVTTNNGEDWTQDFTPFSSSYPNRSEDSPPQTIIQPAGVAFDRSGHTIIAGWAYVLQRNFRGDFPATEITAVEGLEHGTYTSNVPIHAPMADCGDYTGYCEEQFFAQGVVTDTSGTATDGTSYIFYTVYCYGSETGYCEGAEAGNSTFVAVSSAGAGGPFDSYAGRSSQDRLNVGAVSAIVDSAGKPHFIYTDNTNSEELILDNKPLASVSISSLSSSAELNVLRCAGYGMTAYCAFNTTEAGKGSSKTSTSVYLAAIDVQSATAKFFRVNNDPVGNGKEHFNPSVAVTAEGDVYVGWYDGRRDPANKNIEYFIGKSTDGGKTFPEQKPVSDVSFNPEITVGSTPQTVILGARIAAGPDGVIHAVWTDTRSGTSTQVYSQNIKW